MVAGAGSGKTETMAARVVWLVANGYARPEQILGLTFTRKAAGELAHRVRTRLGQLVRRLGVRRSDPSDDMIAGEPTVATYHSYAARVVTEHGLRAGYEPATRLLTEAARWQLVDAAGAQLRRRHVRRGPGAEHRDRRRAGARRRAGRAPGQPRTTWRRGRAGSSPRCRRLPGRVYADVDKVLARQQIRLELLPLVRAYEHRKHDLEAMDFGDQLARAARVARDHPEVGGDRAGPFPGGVARRIPGHQPRPGGAAAGAVRRRSSGHRGR